MDPESQKLFDEILAQGPSGLSAANADFLRARREYLSEEQAKIFAQVLEPEVPAPSKKKADAAE